MKLDIEAARRQCEAATECEVCGAAQRLDGDREHGRGCYMLSSDGGGVDSPDATIEISTLTVLSLIAEVERLRKPLLIVDQLDVIDLDALAAKARSATQAPWDVLRCDHAPDDAACGLYAPDAHRWTDPKSGKIHRGVSIASDASLDECHHVMPRRSAEFIAAANPATVLRLIDALRDMAIESSARSALIRRLDDALLEALDIADEWTPSAESDPMAKEIDDRIAELRRMVSP